MEIKGLVALLNDIAKLDLLWSVLQVRQSCTLDSKLDSSTRFD